VREDAVRPCRWPDGSFRGGHQFRGLLDRVRDDSIRAAGVAVERMSRGGALEMVRRKRSGPREADECTSVSGYKKRFAEACRK
jgi:hypothetical protein